MKKLLFAVAFIASLCPSVQAQFRSSNRTEADLETSVQNLRNSMGAYRDASLNACKFGDKRACEVAELTNVQILLVDIETKYRRESRGQFDSELAEKAKKIQHLASGARSAIDELASKIK